MSQRPITRWTKEFKHYHFEIFYHVGRACYGVEVYDFKQDKLAEDKLGFDSFYDAYFYLNKYGYGNVSRFINS